MPISSDNYPRGSKTSATSTRPTLVSHENLQLPINVTLQPHPQPLPLPQPQPQPQPQPLLHESDNLSDEGTEVDLMPDDLESELSLDDFESEMEVPITIPKIKLTLKRASKLSLDPLNLTNTSSN